MDLIRKLFPISFKYTASVGSLIIGILIYIVGGAIAGLLIGLLTGLPLIGWLFGLVGSLLGLYTTVGIVLEVLAFLKVLK